MQKNGGAQTVGEASRRLRGDLSDFLAAVGRSRNDLATRLGTLVRERPIACAAFLFGIGYVLGGGLFSRTTSRLLGVGARMYGVALARNLIGDAFQPQHGP